MEKLLEIYKKLDNLNLTLKPFVKEDEAQMFLIFQNVVESGCQFPYEENSIEEFHRHFFSPGSQVYSCCSGDEVIAGFYIKPNFTGRSNHISNAAYMIKNLYRGKGIGTLLVKASLYFAKQLGFTAMQFNMVLSQNFPAIKLYQKLGFNIIGTIPKAIRHQDKNYQDGLIMHRTLDDI